MSTLGTIGLVNGGGDAPGLNAVTRAVGSLKMVPPDCDIVRAARAIGISFGAE